MLTLPPAADLEARRIELGWTMEVLADRTGFCKNTILKCLHGGSVRLETFVVVADTLGFQIVVIRKDAA